MRVLAVGVDRSEVEESIRWLPPALLLRDGVDGGGAEEGVRVGEVDLANHERVRHDGDVIVGHALGRPDGGAARGIWEDVEDEALLRVCYQQRLCCPLEGARAVESVGLCELAHELDGVARGGRALHHDLAEGVDREEGVAALARRLGA